MVLFAFGEEAPPPKPAVAFKDDAATPAAANDASSNIFGGLLAFVQGPPAPAPAPAPPAATAEPADDLAADTSADMILALKPRLPPSARGAPGKARSSYVGSRGYSKADEIAALQASLQRIGTRPASSPPSSSSNAAASSAPSKQQVQREQREARGAGAGTMAAGMAPPKHGGGGGGGGGGLPPSKQMQQEEVLAPLDEEEREALERRVRARAGRFATARPGAGGGGYGGGGAGAGSYWQPGAGGGATAGGGGANGGPIAGDTARGYGTAPYAKGHAGYSARGGVGGVHPGYISPQRARVQALTARTAQDRVFRFEAEKQEREKARRRAQHAAALAAAKEQEEEEKRQEARRALERSKSVAQERAQKALASARKAGLPPMKNIGLAMKAPPTERQKRVKRRNARPEWGTGHAGGMRLRKDTSSEMRFHERPSGHDTSSSTSSLSMSYAGGGGGDGIFV